MGRNILGRKKLTSHFQNYLFSESRYGEENLRVLITPLTIILFLLWTASVLSASEGSLPPRRTAGVASFPAGTLLHEEARKGHAGPEVYSIDISPHSSIENYRKWYKSNRWAYLTQCLNRSREYERHIRKLLDKYDLPEELFYLPVVESAFKPYAYSHAGASGLWQFMKNSIYPYDMKVDSWRDERRDFWKSTDAALQKLAYNKKKTGDWLLALAAYNCGLGKVTRIMKQYGINDFWTMWERKLLPRETISYIPSFLAVSSYGEHRGSSGLPVSWEPLPQWTRISLDKAVSLKDLSRRTGLSLTRLRNANAELYYGVTPPASYGYKLKVPQEYAEKVVKVLAEPGFEYQGFTHHTIRSGDTLSEIAQAYDSSVSALMSQNPGLNPLALPLGYRLVIPVSPGSKTASSTPASKGTNRNYKVKQGDTLWGIAKLFGTTAVKIASLNGLQINEIIRTGMVLAIPGGS